MIYAKNKVFDTFSFFNELDLLDLRFNILDPYVDFFIIIESPFTFSGLEKPLYFKENKKRYSKWDKKIINYVVDDYPNDEELCRLIELKGYAPEPHFHRAFYQKESIKKALLGMNPDKDDICYFGDADEIWKPKEIDDKIYKLNQLCYSYYLNNRSSEQWRGTVVTRYKNIINGCLNEMRARPTNFLDDGGWHFSNLGGIEAVIKKIESYDHQEFNNYETKSKIEERIRNNQDFLGRNHDYLGLPFKLWKEEKNLPKYLLDNIEKYKHLMV